MRISVDTEACGGYGVCSSLNDVLFELEGTGPVSVLFSDVPAEYEDDARLAVESCPTAALYFES